LKEKGIPLFFPVRAERWPCVFPIGHLHKILSSIPLLPRLLGECLALAAPEVSTVIMPSFKIY
jgi:hypothetical protein